VRQACLKKKSLGVERKQDSDAARGRERRKTRWGQQESLKQSERSNHKVGLEKNMTGEKRGRRAFA